MRGNECKYRERIEDRIGTLRPPGSMKLIGVVMLGLAIGGCSPTSPMPEPSFTITTDSGSYSVDEVFSAGVTFANNLGRTVLIYESGCGPMCELDRAERGSWLLAISPLCAGFAIGPTELQSGQVYRTEATFLIEPNPPGIATGLYRLRFRIREEDGVQPLDPGLTVSNSFLIRE